MQDYTHGNAKVGNKQKKCVENCWYNSLIEEYLDKPPSLSTERLVKIREIGNKTTRDRGYTRTYYSYPAKFLAHLPRELIKMFTNEGDLVYDAYCGGGTTGLECMLLNRRFVGYDINPFAILVSNAKTKLLDTNRLNALKQEVTKLNLENEKDILDNEDKILLGPRLSKEISAVAYNIDHLQSTSEYKDFFKVALIHATKIVGRRDFGGRKAAKNQQSIFSYIDEEESLPPGPSILPILNQKIQKMVSQMATLPKQPKFMPKFFLGSNHRTYLKNEIVDLMITSPPYKDLDVEYMQIQIQRPESHRSKRSDVIAKILDTSPIKKDILCGYKNDKYWRNLERSLEECYRVMKPKKLAFFWIGFKNAEDKEKFQTHLGDQGFNVVEDITVKLSKDRAASSRSTHHGKETHMLQKDFLFVTIRV